MSEVTRETESEAEDTPGLRKGRMTLAACTECRRRKLKCSGERPICNRCYNKSYTCIYDVEDGVTRLQATRSDLERLQNHVADLETVIQALRHESIENAIEILATLRVGQIIQELSQRLRSQTERRS